METFDDTPGVLMVNVRSYVDARYYLILRISYELCATIFFAKILKISCRVLNVSNFLSQHSGVDWAILTLQGKTPTPMST